MRVNGELKKKKKETWVQRDRNDSKLTENYNSISTKSDPLETIRNLMGRKRKCPRMTCENARGEKGEEKGRPRCLTSNASLYPEQRSEVELMPNGRQQIMKTDSIPIQ
jgi:hypothetical protein